MALTRSQADGSFSLELDELHKRIQSLTRKRDKLEAKLQEEFSAPSLALTTSVRWGYVVTAKRKDGKLPKERFHAVAEAKSLRTYAYNVSGPCLT